MFLLNSDTGVLIWNGSPAAQLSVSEALVLQCLMDDAGTLVSKEILLAIGWPGKVVQPNSLTVAIKNIRKALASIPTDAYVETRHRKGYILHIPSRQDNENPSSDVNPPYHDTASPHNEPLKKEGPFRQVKTVPMAQRIIANMLFYGIALALAFWSLFISGLDTPLSCHKVNKASLCGFSELNEHDISSLAKEIGDSEGSYLYGYDKEIDKIHTYKMD